MKDLKIILQFIADGNGTIISSGMAKGILDGIKHLEQENAQLKIEAEVEGVMPLGKPIQKTKGVNKK